MTTTSLSEMRRVASSFARLRWRLFRSTVRGGGAMAAASVVGLIGATLAGAIGGASVAVGARTADDPESVLTIVTVVPVVVVIAIGVITGVSQPVDPRVIASEPLRDRLLTLGLLSATAAGPPGLATTLFVIGLLAGSITSAVAILPALIAAAGLLVTLATVSRTTANLLALVNIRRPRAGQILVGLVSLGFYGSFQLLPQGLLSASPDRRVDLATGLAWTPPGQIGRAFARATDDPLLAIGHAALGSLWLPIVGWVLVVTTRTILSSSPTPSAGPAQRSGLVGRIARRACGRGDLGAIAWRGIRTRMRNPKSALETFVGAGVGLGIVLVPALTADEIGAAAVLVGGAVQLAVLFMAGNSFGSDGPALGAELLCGVEPSTIVRAKVRSILIVASPLAVIGPLAAAAITSEWVYLPAGVTVGIAGLMSGAGGAIVQSTVVPIAVPESDNPLASGDSGSGLLAALILVVVLLVLSLATLPFALVLVYALAVESIALVMIGAALTVLGGAAAMRVGVRIATQRWRTHEPEIHDAVIPSR